MTPATETGSGRGVLVVSPISLASLSPRQTGEPEARSTHAWRAPAPNSAASVMPATVTGLLESVVDRLPNCPLSFWPQQDTVPEKLSPQHHTVRSVLRAHVYVS